MNFNGKYWHKPGHLGMTTAEVKKALTGVSSIIEITSDDIDLELTDAQFNQLALGNLVTIAGSYTDFFPALPKYNKNFIIDIPNIGVYILPLIKIGPNEADTAYKATMFISALNDIKTLSVRPVVSDGSIVGLGITLE